MSRKDVNTGSFQGSQAQQPSTARYEGHPTNKTADTFYVMKDFDIAFARATSSSSTTHTTSQIVSQTQFTYGTFEQALATNNNTFETNTGSQGNGLTPLARWEAERAKDAPWYKPQSAREAAFNEQHNKPKGRGSRSHGYKEEDQWSTCATRGSDK